MQGTRFPAQIVATICGKGSVVVWRQDAMTLRVVVRFAWAQLLARIEVISAALVEFFKCARDHARCRDPVEQKSSGFELEKRTGWHGFLSRILGCRQNRVSV